MSKAPIKAGDMYHLLLMRLTQSKQALYSAGELLLETDASPETFQSVVDADAVLKDLIERLDSAKPLTTPKQRHEASH